MTASNERLRIMHIITGLQTGGAEMMLYKLLTQHYQRFDCRVISLGSDGSVGDRIRALGVPVHILGMSGKFPNPLSVLRLARLLRENYSEVVQTWMYHSDLVGGLASWLAGNIPLVWGLHNFRLEPGYIKTRTRRIAALNARLSTWLPDRIVSCSQEARRLHEHLGYCAAKMFTIPNGFDLELFKPDPAAAGWLRTLLGIPADSLLIGHIGRFDPNKDYRTLLEAAGKVSVQMPEVHFVLCGDGITTANPELSAMLHLSEKVHRLEQVHLLGRREDIQQIMAGLDLSTLTSYSEAFPNVVGEAMACGVPCVVTDTGDCAYMVGDTGRVVQPGDPTGLAQAWCELLSAPAEQRRRLGLAARQRVEQYFSLPEVSNVYAQVYQSVHQAARAGSRT